MSKFPSICLKLMILLYPSFVPYKWQDKFFKKNPVIGKTFIQFICLRLSSMKHNRKKPFKAKKVFFHSSLPQSTLFLSAFSPICCFLLPELWLQLDSPAFVHMPILRFFVLAYQLSEFEHFLQADEVRCKRPQKHLSACSLYELIN